MFKVFLQSWWTPPPPQEVFRKEQLTMRTFVCEGKVMAPRPCAFPATCPEEVRALPHDMFGENVSRLHIFQHTFHRPLWHVSIMPLKA